MLLLGEEFVALAHERGSGGTSGFQGLEKVVSQSITAGRLGIFPNNRVAEYSHSHFFCKCKLLDHLFL